MMCVFVIPQTEKATGRLQTDLLQTSIAITFNPKSILLLFINSLRS
jgi:hypothetical protein